MIAPSSSTSPVQDDSQTLKALEIALIRLKTAEERNSLLEDRLKAKDEIITAKDGTIAILEKQKELAEKMQINSGRIETIDQFRVEACQQQLSRADAEIARLRSPSLFKRLFSTEMIGGFAIGYGAGRLSK